MSVKFSEEFQTVHVWHQHIQNDQLYLICLLLVDIETFPRGTGCQNRVAQSLQHIAQHFQNNSLIVDQQNHLIALG